MTIFNLTFHHGTFFLLRKETNLIKVMTTKQHGNCTKFLITESKKNILFQKGFGKIPEFLF